MPSSGKAQTRSRQAMHGYLTGPEAIRAIQGYRDIYGELFTATQARRICEIAQEFTYKAEACDGGFIGVRYRGNVSGEPGKRLFEIEDHTGKSPGKPTGRVATAPPVRYTQVSKASTQGGNVMPAARQRTKPTAQAQAQEPEEELEDFSSFLTKAYTATMTDFIQWFEDEVLKPARIKWTDLDADRLLVLGVQLYSKFQVSDFNRNQKAQRRADRAAAANGSAAEPEPEAPARPARRGAKAGAPAAAGDGASAPARPARRTRGGAKAAQATEAY